MMPIKLEALPVVLLYGLALFVILYVAPRISPDLRIRAPWWRSVRFWASFVAITQIVVYALFS
jgi:hypothetical protein